MAQVATTLGNAQPATVPLTYADLFPVSRGGTSTRKASLTDLVTLLTANFDAAGAGAAAQAFAIQRANHTGTQAAATISDFSEAVDDRVANLIGDTGSIAWAYNDAGNVLTAALVAGGVSNSRLADMNPGTVKGRTVAAGVGAPTDLSQAQLTALINDATQALDGAMTASDKKLLDCEEAGIFHVEAYGAAGDGTANDVTAINAAVAAAVAYQSGGVTTGTVGGAGQRGAIVKFGPGIFKINSAPAAINANGIIIQGAGRGATTILVNFAGSDVFKWTAGNEFCEIRDLQMFAAIPRTAGAYINTSGAHDIIIRDIAMTGAFKGISVSGGSIKVTINNYIIDSCVAATGIGIEVINGAAGDTYIGQGILSNPAGSKPLAGVRIQQSGHFSIFGLNCTSCVSGLLLDPAAGQDVSYGFISRTLFDSCGTNGVLINPANSATARVRSIKFVDAWCGGCGAQGFLQTSQGASAIVDDILFSNGRILNSGTHGYHLDFGTNTVIDNNTIAGSSQASSGVNQGVRVTAGISKFRITNNTAQMAGTAGNTQQWGILVAAGASDEYIIRGNFCADNVNPGVSDGGTGRRKLVDGNTGMMLAPDTVVAPIVLPLATVTKLGSMSCPANYLKAGTKIRITAFANNTAVANTLTLTVKYGTADTNADATIATLALGLGTAAVGGARFVVEFCIQSVGATGKASCTITCLNNGSAGLTNAPCQNSTSALITLSTTVANFLGLYGASTVASVITVQSVDFEVPKQ